MPRRIASTKQTTRCECGRRKTKKATACARCTFLDGEHPGQARMISALRQRPRQTIYALSAVLGLATRNVITTLRKLEAGGRVKRTLVPDKTGAADVATYDLVEPRRKQKRTKR